MYRIDVYPPGETVPSDLKGYSDYVLTQFIVDHFAQQDSHWLCDYMRIEHGSGSRDPTLEVGSPQVR